MSQSSSHKLNFLDFVWEYKISLAIYIVGISFLTFIVLYIFGGVPNELKVIPETTADQTTSYPTLSERFNNASSTVSYGALPTRVIISKIGVDTVVNNPTASDNDTLNNELLKGAVRYPGSGTLDSGNMFIFGHSTGIKIVNNQAYKTFNNLKNLTSGDTIEVQSASRVYTYTVSSVKLEDSDAALVDLSTNQHMLTLSTCDVFGEKQQRFVVEASYTSNEPL